MSIDPAEMVTRSAKFFGQAATDPRLGERMGLAQTTVHIHFDDSHGITLLLDRQPIGVEDRIVGSAEVELWGSADVWMEFVRREKQLAMAIVDGEVTYRGPVRKFLRVVPILRSFDFEPYTGLGAAAGTPAS